MLARVAPALWYQRDVHRLAWLATALLCAGCAQPGPPASSPTTPAPTTVHPAGIERARTALPPGYEVAALAGPPSPVALWGYGPGWTADPPQCAVLGDPGTQPSTPYGWSASGPGGIVHVAVTGAVTPDPALLSECAHWSVTAGHTSGQVAAVPAPAVDDAASVGWATTSTTVVEGGTETHAHADTAVAYLGDYVVVVAVVTDPGSPHPALGAQFAADMLVKSVSAVRG